MPSFDSIEALDRHFKSLLDGAEEDALPQITFERDRARLDFQMASFNAQQAAAERKNAIDEAVKKYPNLKGSEDFLKGDDAKGIMASAMRLAEKIGGGKDAAKEAYGPSTSVVRQPQPYLINEVQDRFDRITREIHQGLHPKEADAQFYVAFGGGKAMKGIRGALRHGAAGRG